MPRGVHNSKRGPKPRPPAEARERNHQARLRAQKKYDEKKRAEKLATLRSPTARALLPEISRAECVAAGLSVSKHQHAALYWMDQHGRLHREDTLSAEELIRQYDEKGNMTTIEEDTDG